MLTPAQHTLASGQSGQPGFGWGDRGGRHSTGRRKVTSKTRLTQNACVRKHGDSPKACAVKEFFNIIERIPQRRTSWGRGHHTTPPNSAPRPASATPLAMAWALRLGRRPAVLPSGRLVTPQPHAFPHDHIAPYPSGHPASNPPVPLPFRKRPLPPSAQLSPPTPQSVIPSPLGSELGVTSRCPMIGLLGSDRL